MTTMKSAANDAQLDAGEPQVGAAERSPPVEQTALAGATGDLWLPVDGRQSEEALGIRRGACRLLRDLGFATLPELTLASGRRADIMALSAAGDIWIVEIKSSVEDFRSDHKWQEYRDFCDRLYFAVAPGFPVEILPEDAGLILADRYGGEVIRHPEPARLAAARRKAVTLSFGRIAALRLQSACDPPAPLPILNGGSRGAGD